MLEKILNPIISRLAFLWRSFGSPRISGDEKAVGAVRTAWGERGKATGIGSGLGPRMRIAVFSTMGVIVAGLAIWLVFANTGSDDPEGASAALATPTVFAGPEYLTEVIALSSAVAAARRNGLISNKFTHVARRVQFGEFAAAIGESYRAERGLLETPPETEVWAFAFAGDVELQLDNGEYVKYDNLTVVLDALTAKVYRVEAFYGEYESEARAPVWLRPPTPTPEAVTQ